MPNVCIVGAGPAGLMAAETAAAHGLRVDVYDAMPSAGRKFLMAGKGGLNLTHAEPIAGFLARYGKQRAQVETWLAEFGPNELRAWARGLGIETFVGSSGRVFPREMKAAPLLRAWLRRLRESGVVFHMRHRWMGWNESGGLMFDTPRGPVAVRADATVLAPGGASWPQLGSDAAWAPLLAARGVRVAPLQPANCGFEVAWNEHFRRRYAGTPVKSVTANIINVNGHAHRHVGECVITESGIEGGVIYALSAPAREAIAMRGEAVIHLDLAPGRGLQRLARDLAKPHGRRSLANHLKEQAGISGVKAGLLREAATAEDLTDAARLAALIKALPLRLIATRPIAEAISSAGGVAFDALDQRLMLRDLPGVFCAGEMLDWEAPTGGYLLTACFASGRMAGTGAAGYVRENASRRLS